MSRPVSDRQAHRLLAMAEAVLRKFSQARGIKLFLQQHEPRDNETLWVELNHNPAQQYFEEKAALAKPDDGTS